MSTDKRNASSDIPIEHAENGTVSATNGAQSGAINDTCMSEGKLTIVVVALAILTFLGILSGTSLNIGYSALMEEFAISADVVQWLTTGYLLLLSVAIPTSPFMVRKFPTKALFVMAIALFSVGTLVGALALNFPMLLAARLIMALGTVFPAAADQHHSRQGSIPQARHDAWVGEFGDVRGSGHRAGVRRIGDGIPELALDFLCHDSVPGDFIRAWRGYRA